MDESTFSVFHMYMLHIYTDTCVRVLVRVRVRECACVSNNNNNNNNNGRNGSCLTWLATSLEEKRRWLIINASIPTRTMF